MPNPVRDSALKSLVVHVDAGTHAEARLRLARRLAQDHGGAVAACYAVTSIVGQLPLEIEVPVGPAVLGTLDEIDQQRRRVARALVDRVAAEAGPPIAWEEATSADPIASLVRRAYCADLLVLGQRDPGRPAYGVPDDLVESVLIDSGTPALVLPYIDTGRSVGQSVLVAWKASRSSALALRAALPFLTRAAEVRLLSWGDDTAPAAQAFLRLHGIDARLETSPETDVLGDRLLSRAADVGADLLVMGCYGHSRAREFVLGGVTRTILGSMTLPVLMAH
jgi:nucleotide-binding universal stress UspA family protein